MYFSLQDGLNSRFKVRIRQYLHEPWLCFYPMIHNIPRLEFLAALSFIYLKFIYMSSPSHPFTSGNKSSGSFFK